jgi:Uma2 family endonuclease
MHFMSIALAKPSHRLGPRQAGRLMTLDEFEVADFKPGFRYELIHGVLIVNPPPLDAERDGNEELGHWLRSYKESHPQGKCLDLTLPEHNLRTRRENRRADRVIWVGLGRQPVTDGPPKQRDAPAIVVEFPSGGTADRRRDYEEKKDEYRDLKVKEYWIIDRFQRTATIYSLRGRRWTKRVYKENDIYSTPLLPGFKLSLKKLFAVMGKYRR